MNLYERGSAFPIRMRNRRAIVIRIEGEQTKGGIILPESARNLSQLATVIGIGPENPEGIKPGDKVLLPKYGGYHYEYAGTSYVLIDIPDLLAVITD